MRRTVNSCNGALAMYRSFYARLSIVCGLNGIFFVEVFTTYICTFNAVCMYLLVLWQSQLVQFSTVLSGETNPGYDFPLLNKIMQPSFL